MEPSLTVGDLARISGITVRTLHHYDEIGLLPASGRTDAGYRTYGDEDVDRLRAILTYRELGLRLDEIAAAVDAEGSPLEVLQAARQRLDVRIRRLRAIARALDETIANEEKGLTMTPDEKLSVFGDFDPAEYEAEAEERWGDTDAYRDSMRRTSAYTQADWEQIGAEAAGVYAEIARLIGEGTDPTSAAARMVVDRHRAHISRWFYECTPEIHAGLGQMYVADERFTASIDKAGEGIAAYLSAAIAAAYSDDQATTGT